MARLSVTALLFVLWSATGAPPGWAAAAADAPPASLAGLDAFVEGAMKDWSVPGLGLAIVRDGEVLVARGYGVRTVGGPDLVDGDTLFVVLRPARYLDETEEVEFGEVHVFVGPRFVLTVRHSEAPEFSSVRRRLESEPDLLRRGPEAVLYAVLDKVVDGYYPVVAGLGNDIDEIEVEVFSGDPKVSRRIYELSREVADFQRATRPLIGMIAALCAGFVKYAVDEELQRYLRDVDDHLTQIVERVDEFRQALRDMLTVNATLVAQQQNEEMRGLSEASNLQNEEVKKISAWAAILFAPTLVGTIYGMNFRHMPELDWAGGYPLALGLMLLSSVVLYLVFKGRRWI